MHDPMTVAFEIKSPFKRGTYLGDNRAGVLNDLRSRRARQRGASYAPSGATSRGTIYLT